MNTNNASLRELTAQEIIGQFRNDLNLSVCDDQAAIEDSIKRQYNKYHRMENKGSPSERQRATQWFKSVNALKKQSTRLKYLDVVYEYFEHYADSLLLVSINNGQKVFDRKLEDNLRQFLKDDCRTNQALEDDFLKRYLEKRIIFIGDKLPDALPSPIENFSAKSGTEEITLTWDKVKENCDRIQMVREVVVVGKKSTKKGVKKNIPLKNDQCSFCDRDISPGIEYKYLIHSVYKKEDGADSVAFAVCMGEVDDAKIEFEKSLTSLSWSLPNKNADVKVYKRMGKSFFNKNAILPSFDGTEEQLYSKDNNSLRDDKIKEGLVYYYLIIVDFGRNRLSNGKELRIEIPKPPEPVKKLSADYSFSDGNNIVTLNWGNIRSNQQVRYVLVKSEGTIAPGNVNGGEIIFEGVQNRFQDRNVISGCRYSYSVFSLRGELYSTKPSSVGPVDIIAEVTDVKAVSGQGTVELNWTTPENVADIVIRREENYFPVNYNDGVAVKALNRNNAKDVKLTNGQKYFYRIFCVYNPDAETRIYSNGVIIESTPDLYPVQIDNMKLEPSGREVLLSWQAPPHGHAVVIRTSDSFNNKKGDLIEIRDLAQYKDRIPVLDNSKASDPDPNINCPFYSLFSMAGSFACYCGTQVGVIIPDVKDLDLTRSRDGVVLRWQWPRDCDAMQIVRKTGSWPTGIDDSDAVKFLFTRKNYDSSGEKYIDQLNQKTGHFHYQIYSKVNAKPGVFFSPGIASGSKKDIKISPWMTIKYSLVTPKLKLPSVNGKLKLQWEIKKPIPDFAGFFLLANHTEVPSYPEDGIELFRWTPGEEKVQVGRNEILINLDAIRQERWGSFLYKAFFVDPKQNQQIIMIHPDYTVPIADTGHAIRKKLPPLKRRYTGKIPNRIICPECFKEFALNKMLYTSSNTGEIKTSKHSFINKILGKPPKYPIDKKGERMIKKLCPESKHELPYTSGTQDNLVIGLVGAVKSGKSHYISSLIHRFEEQAGNDFNVALIPVTSETQDRYRDEFYKPLFKNKIEIDKTLGGSAPLIYAFTFGGELWKKGKARSITLALYDTAGENFENPETTAQMVGYLGKASGVIFLVDPLQSDQLFHKLPEAAKKGDAAERVPPNTIFANVLRVMTAEAQGNLSRIPVAVALSKCDVLEDMKYFDANSLWASEHRHKRFYDQVLHDDMAALVSECMRTWCPQAYQTVRNNFPRHAFFGVSATGCCSDSNGKYKFIAPRRVEDPFLWILTELGVIPTR